MYSRPGEKTEAYTEDGLAPSESFVINLSLPILIFFNVYLFGGERETERERERDRERESERVGEGQRERETQNPKQAPGSELSAQSPTWGSNS